MAPKNKYLDQYASKIANTAFSRLSQQPEPGYMSNLASGFGDTMSDMSLNALGSTAGAINWGQKLFTGSDSPLLSEAQQYGDQAEQRNYDAASEAGPAGAMTYDIGRQLPGAVGEYMAGGLVGKGLSAVGRALPSFARSAGQGIASSGKSAFGSVNRGLDKAVGWVDDLFTSEDVKWARQVSDLKKAFPGTPKAPSRVNYNPGAPADPGPFKPEGFSRAPGDPYSREKYVPEYAQPKFPRY